MRNSTNEVIELFSKDSDRWKEVDLVIWTTNWRFFASNLGLLISVSDLIEKTAVQYGSLTKLLIETWVKKNGDNATICALINALNRTGYELLADKILGWKMGNIRANQLIVRENITYSLYPNDYKLLSQPNYTNTISDSERFIIWNFSLYPDFADIKPCSNHDPSKHRIDSI